jgi:small nuclear ribonucleoprotein (snRNP)-like protein
VKQYDTLLAMEISDLKPFEDSEVILDLKDGEVLRTKLASVDSEYENITVDDLETNRPENYKDPDAAYVIAASDIVSIRKGN